MADLEELVVTIDAQIGGLVEGMDKAEDKTEESTKSMRDDLEKLTAEFRDVTDKTVKWSAATVVAAAAAAAAIVQATTEQVTALDRSSQRLGVNVEVLSAYAQAAKAAGLTQEEFVDGLQQLNIQIADFVQTGGGGAFDLITQLGIDAKALNELKPDQQLLALADAIKDVPESDALKFLDDIGSDALAAMLPLLREGGASFRAMADEALNAGRVIRTEDVTAIRLMDAELKRSQGDVEALGAKFTGALAPFIIVATKEARKLSDEGVAFGGIAAESFTVAAQVVGVFANGLRGAEIIFNSLELGASGFVSLLAEGLATISGDESLKGFAASSLKQTEALRSDLADLLEEPLPSGAVEKFSEEFLAKVDQLREDVIARSEDAEPIKIPVVPEIEKGLDTLDPENVRFFSDERVKEAVIQLEFLNKEFADSQRTQLDLLTERFEKEGEILEEARDRDKISKEDFEIKKAEIENRFNEQRLDLAMTERDRLIEERDLELQAIQQFFEQQLITEEEFLRRKAELEKRFRVNNIKLAQDEAKSKTFFNKQSTTDVIAGIESLGKVNEKAAKAAFKINQAKALSDAIVSTAAGIQRAFADLPFPAALAASAAVAASGVAQIATITSQSFGGGGGSPTAQAAPAAVSDATPSAATGGEVTAEVSASITSGEGTGVQTIFVNLGGDELGDVLVDTLNRAIKDGRGQETPVLGTQVSGTTSL